MNNARPNLEALFNGSASAEPPLTWLNGQSADTPTDPPPVTEQTPGLFDPVTLAERYFAILQVLLDLQREFGLRLAQQIAVLAPMNRQRR